METGYSEYCVYTVVHPDRMAEAARRAGPTACRESKPWATARRLWRQAQATGVGFPILCGDATDYSRLGFWGLLTGVEFHGWGTRFVVDQVHPFPDKHAPQELILRSTGKRIAPHSIRPYAICHTPDCLPAYGARPAIA